MTEQQHYDIIATYPNAELRRYSRCTVADITLTGSAERAGNRAFGPLVRYISAKQVALSAYSRNSFMSIGSYGSFMSIGSVGSAFSIGSIGSFASVLSVLSGASKFAVMSWKKGW